MYKKESHDENGIGLGIGIQVYFSIGLYYQYRKYQNTYGEYRMEKLYKDTHSCT